MNIIHSPPQPQLSELRANKIAGTLASMNRHKILKAAAATMADRKADYGDHNLSFDCIAAAWEAYLTKANGHSVRVEAHDVASLMAVFKLIRSTQPPAPATAHTETGVPHTHTQRNVDDFVDVACYAAFAAELGARQEYADLAKEFGFDILPSSLA